MCKGVMSCCKKYFHGQEMWLKRESIYNGFDIQHCTAPTVCIYGMYGPLPITPIPHKHVSIQITNVLISKGYLKYNMINRISTLQLPSNLLKVYSFTEIIVIPNINNF